MATAQKNPKSQGQVMANIASKSFYTQRGEVEVEDIDHQQLHEQFLQPRILHQHDSRNGAATIGGGGGSLDQLHMVSETLNELQRGQKSYQSASKKKAVANNNDLLTLHQTQTFTKRSSNQMGTTKQQKKKIAKLSRGCVTGQVALSPGPANEHTQAIGGTQTGPFMSPRGNKLLSKAISTQATEPATRKHQNEESTKTRNAGSGLLAHQSQSHSQQQRTVAFSQSNLNQQAHKKPAHKASSIAATQSVKQALTSLHRLQSQQQLQQTGVSSYEQAAMRAVSPQQHTNMAAAKSGSRNGGQPLLTASQTVACGSVKQAVNRALQELAGSAQQPTKQLKQELKLHSRKSSAVQ